MVTFRNSFTMASFHSAIIPHPSSSQAAVHESHLNEGHGHIPFWHTIYQGGYPCPHYSAVAILHAIHTGRLHLDPPLYKSIIRSHSPNEIHLEFDVRSHSRTIQSIMFISIQRGEAFDVQNTFCHILIQYKYNLDVYSLQDIEKITYDFSFPNGIENMSTLYPYFSLLTSNTFQDDDIQKPLTLFKRHADLFESLHMDDTFIERYDPVNLQQSRDETEHKWRTRYNFDPRHGLAFLKIGNHVQWTSNYTSNNGTYMTCHLKYEQVFFGTGDDFVDFITTLLHTLAPGLPPDYRHVVAASISTKERKAWSTMSKADIANSRSIFSKLPPALVEDLILRKRIRKPIRMDPSSSAYITEIKTGILTLPEHCDPFIRRQMSDRFLGTHTHTDPEQLQSIPITVTYRVDDVQCLLHSILITFNVLPEFCCNMDTVSTSTENAWYETLSCSDEVNLYVANYSPTDFSLCLGLTRLDTHISFYPC